MKPKIVFDVCNSCVPDVASEVGQWYSVIETLFFFAKKELALSCVTNTNVEHMQMPT